MSAFLKCLGLLLGLVLLLWIFLQTTRWQQEVSRPLPQFHDLGFAFSGSTSLPLAEIQGTFTLGRDEMKNAIIFGNHLSLSAYILDWISFGFTAAITVIAGYLGTTLPTGRESQQALARLLKSPSAKRYASLIGLLAALASVCNAASSRLEAAAHKKYENSERVKLALASGEKDIKDAASEDAARRVLDELTSQLLRYK